MNTEQLFAELQRKAAVISDLGGATSLMSWDQETTMPSGGAQARAEQFGTLARLAHEYTVDPGLGDLLRSLDQGLSDRDYGDPTRSIVRVMLRDHTKQSRVPGDLVAEIAQHSAAARETWKEARSKSDFSIFVDDLEKQFELSRRLADALGYQSNPYDALLDQFEAGLTFDLINEEFQRVKPRLSALIARIAENSDRVTDQVLRRHYPQEGQMSLGRRFAEAMGFDFNRGRLDLSTHPFTSGSSDDDVRLTTRVDEHYLPDCVMSTIHEAGHGIHFQNNGREFRRFPFRFGLALAESQSRFYENQIGRTREFWEYALPAFKENFPDATDVTAEDLYRAVNKSEPSFIRVDADEVTYGMHIMLRFELENSVVNGDLSVRDLPREWNARMQEYLGITPPNDAKGVLQDIHWSQGGIGYFPDYLLGSMLSSQLWESLESALPNARDKIRTGDFAPLTDWLKKNVQRHGGAFTFTELTERATGAPFSSEPYMRYLEEKFGELYGLS
jgi:carboxypeptidase Taq